MIAVIFELCPQPGQRDAYFDLAAALRDELAGIDGFLSVERFESLTTPGKFLSLSFWRDEAAVATWRRHARHRQAQAQGRAARVLVDYRLRVAQVLRDYGPKERTQAPHDAKGAWRRRPSKHMGWIMGAIAALRGLAVSAQGLRHNRSQ